MYLLGTSTLSDPNLTISNYASTASISYHDPSGGVRTPLKGGATIAHNVHKLNLTTTHPTLKIGNEPPEVQ